MPTHTPKKLSSITLLAFCTALFFLNGCQQYAQPTHQSHLPSRLPTETSPAQAHAPFVDCGIVADLALTLTHNLWQLLDFDPPPLGRDNLRHCLDENSTNCPPYGMQLALAQDSNAHPLARAANLTLDAHLRDLNGQSEQAIAILEQSLAIEDTEIIADSLLLRLAKLQHKIGKYEEAIAILTDIINQYPNRKTYFYAREFELTVLQSANQLDQLYEATKRFLADFPDYPQQRQLKWRQIQTLRTLSQNALADELLQSYQYDPDMAALLIREKQDQPFMMAPDDAETPNPDYLTFLDRLLRKRRWLEATYHLKKSLKQYPLSIDFKARFAKLAYDQSDYPNAIGRLKEILPQIPRNNETYPKRKTESYRLCEALLYNQNNEEAIDCFAAYNQKYYRRATQAEHLAQIFEQIGEHEVAFDLFLFNHDFQITPETSRRKRRLIQKNKKQFPWTFQQAQLAFNAKAFVTAEIAFAALLKQKKGKNSRAQMRYWLGRSKMAQGLEDAAIYQFKKTIETQSLGYYAILAYSRLVDLKAFDTLDKLDIPRPTNPVLIDPNTNQKPNAQIQWPRISINDFPSLNQKVRAYSPEITLPSCTDAITSIMATDGETFPDLRRAYYFSLLDRKEATHDAIRNVALEFFALKNAFNQRKQRLPSLTRPYLLGKKRFGFLVDNRPSRRQRGYWGIELDTLAYPLPAKKTPAYKAAIQRQKEICRNIDALTPRLTTLLAACGDYYLARRYNPSPYHQNSTPNAENRYLWSYAMPRAFPTRITRASRREGLNPYLLWSVMNIESGFNPDSLSSASAYGLLQVIPMTGRKIAQALEIDDFGYFQLLDANTSIDFGAYYLSRLMRKFHQQEILALAGYNGGPHYVARWLLSRGRNLPADAFVEQIAFNQAKHYVKKGLTRLLIYMRIYGNEPNDYFYIGNALDTSFEPMPNY